MSEVSIQDRLAGSIKEFVEGHLDLIDEEMAQVIISCGTDFNAIDAYLKSVDMWTRRGRIANAALIRIRYLQGYVSSSSDTPAPFPPASC